jgi:hypothetical protein
MTFIVNQDGIVYQKDLGKKDRIPRQGHAGIQPDASWRKAEDEPAQTASAQ